ncbi:uncharacterized protein LOC141717475 [Apium graveolens]|uniref:uncharacterized protein LOC141717475 n=1 Tax=Apium graveolens TaxID=4045 RepID=UPI003D7C0002
MASTAISLHLKRINHLKHIKHFSSSSSSSIPPPPPQNNDETTPSNQPSFSSYLKNLNPSLQQTQQPLQQTQQTFQQTQQTFQQTFQRSPQQSHFPHSPPPTKAASFDEIRKNLSEFRNRTAPPPNPNSQSQFPNPSRGGSSVSFQELYKKSVASGGESSSDNAGGSAGGKMSYDAIRESLKQLRVNKPVDVNKGSMLGGSKLTDSLFGNTKASTPVYGGGSLPAKVFGKEGSKKDGEAGETKTKFLRMYTYGDLGKKLKMLRPEEAKEKKGWFSLKELSERLIKLRDNEEKESEADTKVYKDIREGLQKLAYENEDKKKSSVYKIDILGQLGGTPNYMMSPPKENLVEKYFHPDNMSSADKMKIELKRVRDEFKMSESDCGSSRVQVAQLTTKIKHLSSTLHKKDKHSRKGLQAMVQQRKKLLKYLRRTDWDSYCFVLDKLGLRDNPDYKN